MIGAIIGAAVSAASAIAGGAKARKAAKKQQAILNSQMAENDNWYNSEYYRDVLDNPESRSYLKTLSGKLYKKDQAIENNAIATGATHENTLAQKQSANEVMSDAVNDIVAQQTARKDGVRRQYVANKQNIQNGQSALYGQQADNWVNMAGNIGNAAMAAGNAFGDAGGSIFSKSKGLPNAGILQKEGVTGKSLSWIDEFKLNQKVGVR